MKEFKPIAMRCNQQQYAEIKQILIDNGFECNLSGIFENWPYLTNNYNNTNKYINNILNDTKNDFNRTVFETWNKDIFLEYCGIKNIKSEFIVGKWYKISNGKEIATNGYYIKFLEINNKNIICSSEYISGVFNKYYKSVGYFGEKSVGIYTFTLLTDLSEIQQYLPDGHPDKITKTKYYKCIKVGESQYFTLNKIYDFESGIVDNEFKHLCLGIMHLKDYGNEFEPSTKEKFDAQNNKPNMNKILEEAKRRYPVGTRFKSAYNSTIEGIVKENKYFIYNNTDITVGGMSGYSVYSKGKWAEIIETPVKQPVTNTEWIPQVGDWVVSKNTKIKRAEQIVGFHDSEHMIIKDRENNRCLITNYRKAEPHEIPTIKEHINEINKIYVSNLSKIQNSLTNQPITNNKQSINQLLKVKLN